MEDVEEQGATARATVARWMPTEPVATLPKAVAGAISVSNSKWMVKENFAIVLFGFPDLGQAHKSIFRCFFKEDRYQSVPG